MYGSVLSRADTSELLEGTEDIAGQHYYGPPLLWWVILFEAATVEEILFRAPLSFVVRVLKHPFLVILAVLGLSAVFGYIHPMGWWSLSVQGVFGLMISVMYLKFGGVHEGNS